MADMGFLPAVKRILDATTPDRQTLLFSATLDGDVDELVRRYQRHPVRHEIEADKDELARMTHRFHAVDHEQRPQLCAEVVASHDSTVIFVRTRHGAERLARPARPLRGQGRRHPRRPQPAAARPRPRPVPLGSSPCARRH